MGKQGGIFGFRSSMHTLVVPVLSRRPAPSHEIDVADPEAGASAFEGGREGRVALVVPHLHCTECLQKASHRIWNNEGAEEAV